MNRRALSRIEQANKEVWVVLSLLGIALLLHLTVGSDRLLLQFYSIPTVVSAYVYGKRHATLTAFASVLVVVLLQILRAPAAPAALLPTIPLERWMEIAGWGGMLTVTAYLMGTLYEHNRQQIAELRSTYDGAARLNDEEFARMRGHVDHAGKLLQAIGGSLRRIVPIILAHHDKFDGSGHHPTQGEEIPVEARVIAVADAYDALTSDRPYRKAMPPHEVKAIIAKGAGHEFDPQVVDAFLFAFRQGAMDLVAVAV